MQQAAAAASLPLWCPLRGCCRTARSATLASGRGSLRRGWLPCMRLERTAQPWTARCPCRRYAGRCCHTAGSTALLQQCGRYRPQTCHCAFLRLRLACRCPTKDPLGRLLCGSPRSRSSTTLAGNTARVRTSPTCTLHREIGATPAAALSSPWILSACPGSRPCCIAGRRSTVGGSGLTEDATTVRLFQTRPLSSV